MTSIKVGLLPVISPNTEILVLGSLPSDISIRKSEYYANPKNQFWRKLYGIFEQQSKVFTYERKIDLLLSNRIGLWDVLNEALREGSLDSNIKSGVVNDIGDLLKSFPAIKKLVFNGKKAFQLFESNFGQLPGVIKAIAPSSSSANTTMSIEGKIKEWKRLLKPNIE